MQHMQAKSQEQEMKVSYELIERNAEALILKNDEDYEQAAEFAQGVKSNIKDVKEYFGPMKEAAHKAHASICAREKEMLVPLLKAEKQCKTAMSEYIRKQQELARQQEAEMRRLAEAEAEAALQKALDAEASGNAAEAEMAMQQAEVADQIKDAAVVVNATPKVSGIGTSKDYEITSIDERAVPISMGSAVIRPVDQKAILRLIKAHKGQINIPGVRFRETVRMSVSARRY